MRPESDVRVLFKQCNSHELHPVFLKPLLENRLQENSFFAYIDSFHPNGSEQEKNYSPEFTRQGAGSLALDEIIKDSLERNLNMLCVVTFSESMKSFLSKKGFKQVEDGSEFYYKIL